MRKTEVMKRALSVLLAFCIMLSYVPTTAYAVTEDNLCEHHEVHTAEVCGYVEGEADCTYHCEVCRVQELVDALPESVTAENVDAAAAQLAAIDTAKAELSDEEIAQVDFAKYSAAISAINTLEGQAGAEVPSLVFKLPVTVDGSTITIEAESSDTIEAIKEKIAEQTTLVNPVLTYDGKELEDGRTLADYEITESSTITVTNYYSVTIGEMTGGAVSADKTTAAEGETVTLTVTPADGYEIDTVSYNDGTTDVTVTASEGVYSITMPAGDVTVTAVFKEKAAEPVETKTIYFNNSVVQWSQVNAYAWESETGTSCLGTWPGTAMTPVEGETSIYSVTVPAGADTIIFNNGSAQTGDQPLSTGNCFKAEETNAEGQYIGSWYTYPCTHADGSYTDNFDGTHSGTCTACGSILAESEAHTPDGNGKCTGCGGAFWTIRVIVGANREDTYIVPAGKDATLNGVYVEEGYVLEGVEVSYTDTNVPVTGFRCGYETITIPGEYVTADLTVGVSVRTLDIENAHDHVYVGVPAFTWAEDHSDATAAWVCLADEETKTLDCTVTYQTQNATCAEEGKTTYTAAVTWNGTDFTDIQTVSIPVDANNHTYDETGKCVCGLQAEAKVGDTAYATLEDAIAAAKNIGNATVTLLADVIGNYTVSRGTDTLDLNGYTIYGTLTVDWTASVTITDNSEAQTGMITASNRGVDNSGTVTVKSGTIDAPTDFYCHRGPATLTGGTFPGGITVENSTLNALLGGGYAYYLGDAVQNLEDDATELTGGDVTVGTCDHSKATYTDNNDGTHTFSFPACGADEAVAHSYTDGKCTVCGAKQPFTVTLNGNGGETFNGDTFDYQEMVTVPYSDALALADYATRFKRAHYTLSGWNTEADGTGTSYEADGSVTVTGDITLYAQWTEDIHTVTLLANGGTFTDGTTQMTVEIGYGKTLGLSTYSGMVSKDGYYIDGWYKDDTWYAPSDQIGVTGDITLTAVWAENKYTLYLDPNGGKINIHGQETTGPFATSFSLGANICDFVTRWETEFTREGYTFQGFTTVKDDASALIDTSVAYPMPGETLTLYAQWEETMHTVTFVYGMGNLSKQTIGEVTPQALNPYTGDPRTGHTFNGWNTKSDGSGTAYTDGQEITLTGDIMLYPQWKVNNYKITWNLDGGQCSMELPASADYGTTVTVSGFSKPGYYLAGLTDQDGNELSPVVIVDIQYSFIMPDKDVTITAEWGEYLYVSFFDGLKWETQTADWTPDLAAFDIATGIHFNTNGLNSRDNQIAGDYTVQWYDASGSPLEAAPTDAGTYTIQITLGETAGAKYILAADTLTYTINPLDLSTANVGLNWPNGQPSYNGQQQLPDAVGATVGNSTYKLPEGSYTFAPVEGKNCTNAGLAYCLIVGDGKNVVGQVEKTYSINHLSLTLPDAAERVYAYDGTPKATDFTNETLPDGYADVEPLYWYEAGSSTRLAEAPSDAGEYEVYVRYTPADTVNYATVYRREPYTINPATITVTANAVSKTYGDADPELTYTVDGLVNSDAMSGELTRAEGTDVGTYAITQGTLTAGSNYTISYTGADLTIKAKAITETDVALNGSLTYTGSEQTQPITVTEGITYTVTGDKATNVGTYELTVTGNGNFTGTATKKWDIEKADVSIVWNSGYFNSYGANMYITSYINGVDGKMITGTAVATVYDDQGNALNSVTCTKTEANGTYFYNNLNKLSDGTYLAPGTYTVRVTFQGNDNYLEKTVELVNYTINKRVLTVTANDNTITYGDIPSASGVTYSGFAPNEMENVLGGELAYAYNYAQYGNVGTYKITPSGLSSDNYEIKYVDGTLTVEAKEITVTANTISKTYGDADPELTYTVVGLVNGDKLNGELARAAGENVGEYDITIGALANSNYEISFTGANLTINAKAITKDDVELSGSLTYTGSEQTQPITVTEGITYAVTGDKATDVGTYELTVTATGNYTGEVKLSWSIKETPAVVDTAPTAKDLTYTGEAQALVTPGTVDGGKLLYSLTERGEYSEAVPTGTDAGPYTVWYYVQGDSNHSNTEKASVTVTIAKADPAIGTVTANVVNDTKESSAIVLTCENTGVAGSLTVDEGQTLKLGDNEIAWTFTPANTGNYITVSGKVTVTVRDTIAPTGTVTLSTDSWSEFLNTITFGKYFKETQKVSVTDADNLSGVAKVEYYETKDILDLDGVKALEDGKWTIMDGGEVSVTAEDAKQFIYYIRIADNSGNVSYLATNGAEFDTTAPVITGVENGKTYYTTQVVTVTDKNLEIVTLNGETVTGTITLDGNMNTSYTIVATDKAGNSTTVTVAMAQIADITDPMDVLTDKNVTSDDKEALEDIVDTADELLKDDNLTDEEKDALEDAKEKAEDLLDTIEDAASDLDTENTEKVKGITFDNVKPEDKEDLEKAKEDLEKALEENPGNYTNEEKQKIQEEINRIDDAIETIEKVENLTDEIEKLPDSVEPDDEEAAKDILDAKEDYDDLTDHEKSLINDELKEKLDDLLADLVDYKITKGDDGKWTKDGGKTLSFTANGPLSKFVGIEIDGKGIDAKNYTVKADQTTITLKASYLETLKTGKHTITVLYTDGEAEGTFRVNRAADPSSPATGDDTNIMLWSGMLCVSTLVLVLLLADRKRRKSTK